MLSESAMILAYCQYMRSLSVRTAAGGMVALLCRLNGIGALNPRQALVEGESGKGVPHRIFGGGEAEERHDGGEPRGGVVGDSLNRGGTERDGKSAVRDSMGNWGDTALPDMGTGGHPTV
jgi:hypothetical protein